MLGLYTKSFWNIHFGLYLKFSTFNLCPVEPGFIRFETTVDPDKEILFALNLVIFLLIILDMCFV